MNGIRLFVIGAGLVTLMISPVPAVAALTVASHSPTSYALGVAPDVTISVTFNGALDPATVTGSSVIVRGLMSGIHPANRSVNGAVLTIDPIIDFPPGEIVTINLTRALRDQVGSNLTGGHSFQFTVKVRGGVLELEETGRWATAPAQTPYFVYGGDLDGDGDPDAALPNETTNDVSVFRNNGDGTYGQHNEYGTGLTPSSLYGDDFDRDGDIDIASANINGSNMTVLLNDGGATSFTSTDYVSGNTCRQVYGGDFDGDGNVDLVTTGFHNNTLNLHFGQGDGTFSPGTTINVSSGPFPVFVGDMNLDGHPDIIAGFQGSPRQVQAFLNQGAGTFAAGPTLAVGAGAWDFFGNDLDGDGDLDLALAEAQQNRVRILYGNGAGGFASSTTVVTGSFPLAIFTADLDGDDDIDVMASDFSGADVRVYENAGVNQFPPADTLRTVQSGSYVWAHDLDGDGDLDLTVVDELADLLFVFRNMDQPTGLPGGGGAPPVSLRLLLPYPDPATSMGAELGFEAPSRERVTLRIYDVSGRLVRTLMDGIPKGGSGQVHWDTRAGNGALVPAGAYLLRLEEGGTIATGRIHVIR